jgi:hypothetical protein
MRIVDFHTFPSGTEHRNALVEAVAEIDLGELRQTDPVADDAPLAIGFPAEWSDDEVKERAAELQEELEPSLADGVALRFALDDADAGQGPSELTD